MQLWRPQLNSLGQTIWCKWERAGLPLVFRRGMNACLFLPPCKYDAKHCGGSYQSCVCQPWAKSTGYRLLEWRAVFAPKNVVVEGINNAVIAMMPGGVKLFEMRIYVATSLSYICSLIPAAQTISQSLHSTLSAHLFNICTLLQRQTVTVTQGWNELRCVLCLILSPVQAFQTNELFSWDLVDPCNQNTMFIAIPQEALNNLQVSGLPRISCNSRLECPLSFSAICTGRKTSWTAPDSSSGPSWPGSYSHRKIGLARLPSFLA